MSNITSKYKNKKITKTNLTIKRKEIPNSDVKEVADQFYHAAEILWAQYSLFEVIQPNSAINIFIPIIINSVFALELYLKSLIADSIIKNKEIIELELNNNVENHKIKLSGGMVTAEARGDHPLTTLFNATEERVKKVINAEYNKSDLATSGITFPRRLKKYNETFLKAKYSYEDSTAIRKVNICELRALMNLMKAVVELLPTKVTEWKEEPTKPRKGKR